MSRTEPKRCPWCLAAPEYVAYHDEEWGVPVRDGEALFGKLVLDGFQAGLSWLIILRKRDDFLRAFDGFDPAKIARYRERRIQKLLSDPGIVRNQAKVRASVTNAQAFLALRDAGEDFSALLWDFVGGAPKVNRWRRLEQIPAETPQSQAMSKALKRLGFKFVGPTICYAFMQAVGMVNDHLTSCYRHRELT